MSNSELLSLSLGEKLDQYIGCIPEDGPPGYTLRKYIANKEAQVSDPHQYAFVRNSRTMTNRVVSTDTGNINLATSIMPTHLDVEGLKKNQMNDGDYLIGLVLRCDDLRSEDAKAGNLYCGIYPSETNTFSDEECFDFAKADPLSNITSAGIKTLREPAALNKTAAVGVVNPHGYLPQFTRCGSARIDGSTDATVHAFGTSLLSANVHNTAGGANLFNFLEPASCPMLVAGISGSTDTTDVSFTLAVYALVAPLETDQDKEKNVTKGFLLSEALACEHRFRSSIG